MAVLGSGCAPQKFGARLFRCQNGYYTPNAKVGAASFHPKKMNFCLRYLRRHAHAIFVGFYIGALKN